MKKIYFIILSLFIFSITFKGMNALTLQESIELAKKNNKELQKAREEVKKYKQNYRDIRGNLFPQLTLSGGYQYKKSEIPKASIPAIIPLTSMLSDSASADDYLISGFLDNALSNFVPQRKTTENNLFGKLQLNQVVFMGGKLINGIKVADKLYHLQEKKYFLVEQEVVFKTEDLFYKCLLAQKVVEIQRDALDFADKYYRQVSQMYEQGLVSEYDLLRAKLEFKKLKPQLTEAEKNSKLALEQFKNHLSWNEKELSLNGEIEIPKIDSVSLETALNEGLKNRMELQLAAVNVEVNEVSLNYEKGNFLPNIALSAEYDYFGQSENSFEKDNFGNFYQVGIGFQMPLFTGFSNTAKIAKARYSLKQTKLDYQNLADMIKLDIRNSYLELRKNEEMTTVRQENVELAKKGLTIAEARYKNQISNQLELLDAQLQLKMARLNYRNSVYATVISNEKLKKAMGKKL